jgi:ParB-like chromosome segregation protein Spo0J
MSETNQRIVEQVPVADLVPHIGNPKLHPEAQIVALMSSIREYGFTNPVLIDENGGIIAGHGRLLAAKRLKMETVPCLRLHGLTPAKKRLYVIADNRLAELGEWDDELLSAQLNIAVEEGGDPALSGFTGDDLAKALKAGDDDEGDPEERGPRPTDDNYSEFALTMEHPKKLRLLATLNAIRKQRDLVKLEDALMHLCDLHQGQTT